MAAALKTAPLLWLCIFVPLGGVLKNPENPGIPSLHATEEDAKQHGQDQADEANGGSFAIYSLKEGFTNTDGEIRTLLLVDTDSPAFEGEVVSTDTDPKAEA